MQKTLIAFFAASILFSGCASYHAASLNTLQSDTMCHSEKKDILIAARTFDKADCKRYLDRDVIAEGYQPVQLYIENKSNQNYFFSVNRISMPCARSEEVAETVHTSTIGRAVGYGVGALFIWPLAIPAIVDGLKSAEANDALDNDYSAKTARDQKITSHSHFNKLIFVPNNEFQQNFTITLINQDSNKSISFNVVAN